MQKRREGLAEELEKERQKEILIEVKLSEERKLLPRLYIYIYICAVCIYI